MFEDDLLDGEDMFSAPTETVVGGQRTTSMPAVHDAGLSSDVCSDFSDKLKDGSGHRNGHSSSVIVSVAPVECVQADGGSNIGKDGKARKSKPTVLDDLKVAQWAQKACSVFVGQMYQWFQRCPSEWARAGFGCSLCFHLKKCTGWIFVGEV